MDWKGRGPDRRSPADQVQQAAHDVPHDRPLSQSEASAVTDRLPMSSPSRKIVAALLMAGGVAASVGLLATGVAAPAAPAPTVAGIAAATAVLSGGNSRPGGSHRPSKPPNGRRPQPIKGRRPLGRKPPANGRAPRKKRARRVPPRSGRVAPRPGRKAKTPRRRRR